MGFFTNVCSSIGITPKPKEHLEAALLLAHRDKHNATIDIDDNGTQGLFINLGGKQGSATYGFENIVTNG